MRQRGIPSLTLVSVFVRQGGGEHTVFFPQQLSCAEKGGKPKIRREETFSPTSASSCHGPDLPQMLSICLHLLMASSPTALPRQVLRAALPLGCSSPETLACRTLTAIQLPPSRSGQKQEAQKEQIEAEKSLTQPQKKPRGEGEEGCYPAVYSQCLNKGLPWVRA